MLKDCNDQETNYVNDWWFEEKHGALHGDWFAAFSVLEDEQERLMTLAASPNTDDDWVRRRVSLVKQMIDNFSSYASSWSM